MNTTLHIPLTPSEAEIWDWATDPMQDYWADLEENGTKEYAYNEAIQFVSDNKGLIINDPEVIQDLIYRLNIQLRGMSLEHSDGYKQHGERMKALRCIKAINTLVDKLRKFLS